MYQQQPKPRGRRKKVHAEPVRPICSQCDKQFSNQSALTKHKLTHSDERKFACQQCSKAFKRHDHLTGHMQTHSNRKPFNCTIQGCDKTYCDARSLRRHKENIHHIVTQCNMAQRKNRDQQQPHQQQQQHPQQALQQQQQQLHQQPSQLTVAAYTITSPTALPNNGLTTATANNNNNTNGHYEQCATSATGILAPPPPPPPPPQPAQQTQPTQSAPQPAGTNGYLNSTGPTLQPSIATPVVPYNDDSGKHCPPNAYHHNIVAPQDFDAQQPSHLLKRRTQRLYSDVQPTRLELTNRRIETTQNQHYHPPYSADYASNHSSHFSFDLNNNNNNNHTPHIEHTPLEPTNRRIETIQSQHYQPSFSADYASTHTSHFSFDFNNNNHLNHTHIEHTPLEPPTNRRIEAIQNQHYHPPYSADYVSNHTTHFSFDFNNNNNNLNHAHVEHTSLDNVAIAPHHTSLDNIAIAPHSAGSMTDSGLGLNVYYEHHNEGGGYIQSHI